jgi:hypothetical protein
MHPRTLKSPYVERRSAFGKECSALGIAREDWEARQRAAIANWNCFGAPVALFRYIDRDLGRPQWADVGMYLQTRHAATSRRRAAQLPEDGRGGAVTSGRADPLTAACRSGTRTPGSASPARAAPGSMRRSNEYHSQMRPFETEYEVARCFGASISVELDVERLVAGRERTHLDRFWDELSANPAAIAEATRQHYADFYARHWRHAHFEPLRLGPTDMSSS